MAVKKSTRKKKEVVENYYKILGTRSNATQETIKKKYIERVKEHPPETHPEQFQQVRKAYEILRDPVKRNQYDLQRQYGGKLETMLEKADELSGREQWKHAAALYAEIIKLDARSVPALIGIAHSALHTDTELTFNEYFDKACESAKEEEKMHIRIIQIQMLFEHDKSTEALELLNDLTASYPEAKTLTTRLACMIYSSLGRADEAFAIMSASIPTVEEQEAHDLDLFIEWIHLVLISGKWNELSKVQQRVRKYLKSLEDEEDRSFAEQCLIDEYSEYFNVGRFREALVFIELAHFMNPGSSFLKSELMETRENVALEKEIDRMTKDQNMFPLVTMHAIEWFFEDYLDHDALYSFRNSIPPHIMEQLQANTEEYAYGISRLKKKYKVVYRYFQDSWDDLFSTLTAGMNREQRRLLR
ncbi:DnaJ domain-containing protein [Paenibacillus sp. GCM10027626]|uniref:J domain-containing protein n=1 Tax=Paenibacillus sp. GCM10027626 TaxID=3273411 RepID=UPI0036424DFD